MDSVAFWDMTFAGSTVPAWTVAVNGRDPTDVHEAVRRYGASS